MKYKGLGVAMVTPMLNNGNIDFDGVEKLTKYLIDGGVDYLVVMGTTGESPAVSFEEKLDVLKKIIDVNSGRLPIVFGVGGNNTSAVVEQLKVVEPFDFDGILSVSPAYNKPTQEGIMAHFSKVCSSTTKDVILYNVPGRTASNMLDQTTLTIANQFDNVVAVKEASGNMAQIMNLLRDKGEGFDIISGDDPITLPMMSMGSIGVISVVGNVLPKKLKQMIEFCQDGNFKEACKIHNSLLQITEAFFKDGNPGGAKYALSVLGICQEHMRLPLVSITQSTQETIKECLSELMS